MSKSGNDKRKRAARDIQAETGMSYMQALREADRRHAETQAAPPSPVAAHFPPAAGEFLHNLLSPVSTPGPPYTHTLVPPETIYRDDADETIMSAPLRPASSDPDFGLGIPGYAVTWGAG